MPGPCNFPKAARVRRRREFLRLQRLGSRRHTQHLVVIKYPAAGGVSRLGVTASKRVGNAVVRNRIKRMVREVFRLCRSDIEPPVDIVVIAKADAHKLSYAQAATEFRASLQVTRR